MMLGQLVLRKVSIVKWEYIEKVIQRINRKDWWQATPVDPSSYSKRGKFLASTYREAEFWGRPNNAPERVTVKNPLIGDEKTIERTLLGRYESESWPDSRRGYCSGKAICRETLRP